MMHYTVSLVHTGWSRTHDGSRRFFTLVLEIQDGKVIRHTDYVDYRALMAAIAPVSQVDDVDG